MNIETLLREEIREEFERLKDMELGTEEYKATVDGLTKLADRLIEIEKANIERAEREKDRAIDNNLKARQIKVDKWDRIIRNSTAVAGIVVPAFIAVWGTKASFAFEEKGTITTVMGRGFIQSLLPKWKK